ncbi:MAG: DUF5057 domain-containing protein [Agathobacter sp.]|nr:DUF5057 domain-containing protein [Agathobacter sp.]
MKKKWKSRKVSKITGRLLAAAFLVLCLAAAGFGIAGMQERFYAWDVVTRGVIKDLNQIPQSKKDIYDNNTEDTKETLGTRENPFLILEVVPYKEYALFGYHISGCEPIDMSQMNGHTQSVMGTIKSLKTGIVEQQDEAFFFEEEPERKLQYDDSSASPTKKVDNQFKNGYYERVAEGSGYFEQLEDGTIKKKSGGNIIWHTMCATEQEQDEQDFLSLDAAKDVKLVNVGDRVYTVRMNSEEDPAYCSNKGYFYYKNNDDFLIKSLKLSVEEAKNYSVVVKTITPSELNTNQNWTKYADLILFTGKEYYGQSGLWIKYNRYNESPTNKGSGYVKNGFVNTGTDKSRDISWSVAMKIFDRVSAKKNFAAIVMGTTLYKVDDPALAGSTVGSKKLYAYDWNLKKTISTVDSGTRSNNNVYKLALMLLSMDQDLFKNLYLTDKNPLKKKLIDNSGNFLLQEDKEDQKYWSIYSFLTIPPVEQTGYINPYDYWTNNSKYGLWESHGILGNLNDGNYNVRVDGHVYTFNDNNALSFDYTAGSEVPNSKFTDYQDYLNEYYNVTDGTNHGGTPSDAVRYILGDNSKKKDDKITGKLNILDIEPCYDYESKKWGLQESYIRMMIPKFVGDIEIKHMTTAEYIGLAEDLNSTYDLIFMGLDCGAYNLGTDGLPVWNDTSMNGKIYFHTGDSSSWGGHNGSGEKRNVDFLWSVKDKKKVEGYDLRFPGNDITKLKKDELEDFLKAGYPIVAVPYLYDTDTTRIDQHSHICDFMKENKEKSTLYKSTDADKIYEAIRNGKPQVEFTQLPNIYNGTTDTGKAEIKDANYLERDSIGRSLLKFKFTVKDPVDRKYKWRVYIDQNQDGKFSKKERFYTGKSFSASQGAQKDIPLSKKYMGLIQWKIEVYLEDNEKVRFVKTGCSAAKNITGTKKQIKVLQIMPNSGGNLNLQEDELFKKYYDALDDYSITVETMKVSDYLKKFKDHPFKFDYSKDVTYEGESLNPSQISDEQKQLLENYNMLIVGFGDMYGGDDLDNENGAVDFIKYFIAVGKGVLFTHDLTSMNASKDGASTWFGYSANMLMRDTMGMNRYQAVSNRISEDERNKIIGYQENYKYDTVTDINGDPLDARHGYTYYCMRRLGTNLSKTNSSGKQIMMPYKTLTKNGGTGFGDGNESTTKVSQINEGQITQYPYKIDQIFNVASTHGQYYQLNMEDPEVTVWYCLSGNTVYDLSPHDAANNYYIYSKKNVFYSGVGHAKVNDNNGDMEAKLFINTMIAAYRASYESPIVEVLNSEAELTDINNLTYQMSFAQEYNNVVETEPETNKEVKIEFSPEEVNAVSPQLNCSVYYDVNGTKEYIDVIYEKDTDKPIYLAKEKDGKENPDLKLDGDGNPYFEGLNNMDEYYFFYPEKYLNEWKDVDGNTQTPRRDIVFKIKNEETKKLGYTKLNMSLQALFLLD